MTPHESRFTDPDADLGGRIDPAEAAAAHERIDLAEVLRIVGEDAAQFQTGLQQGLWPKPGWQVIGTDRRGKKIWRPAWRRGDIERALATLRAGRVR